MNAINYLSDSIKANLNYSKPESRSAGPFSVNLDVTYRCNFRCSYCDRWKQPRADMELTTSQITSLFDDLKELGCRGVGISGGEPLLREDLFQLIQYGNEIGLEVGFVTNASLVTPETIKKINTNRPRFVYVSLDSFNKEIFCNRRLEDQFENVLSGIELLVKNQSVNQYTRVGINAVIAEDNAYDIVEFVREAKSRGIKHIGLQPLHEFEANNFLISNPKLKEKLDPVKLAKVLDDLVKLNPEFGIPYISAFPTFFSHPEKLKFKCFAGMAYLAIDAFGNVYPCDPLRSKDYLIGNIKETRFKQLWFSDRLTEVRKKIYSPCRGCTCWMECTALFNTKLDNSFLLEYLSPHHIKRMLHLSDVKGFNI